MLTLIAAVAKDGAIGHRGQLLWHIPEDLKHFKTVTMGAPVVMGRATWESLPFRPLPGRLNIVVSRNSDYRPFNAKGADVSDRVRVFTDLDAALNAAENEADSLGKEAFVIGGGHIYAATIDRATALELTLIDAEVPDADTHFPPVDPALWQQTQLSAPHHPADSPAASQPANSLQTSPQPTDSQPTSLPSFRFARYERRP